MSKIIEYLVLPSDTSEPERQHLARVNKAATVFFAFHIPLLTIIALLNHTGPLMALILSTATFLGPVLAANAFANPRSVSIVQGITAIFMGGLLVHFGQGPMQTEMHFYFFMLIALTSVFGNPMVVVVAALTAALHHVILWLVLPHSLLNYGAPFSVILVHATFVIIDSAATTFVAASLFKVIRLETSLRRTAGEIHVAVGGLFEAVDTVASSVQGLTMTVDEITTGAQEQVARLEQSAAGLEEISATVASTATNARRAASLAAEAQQAAVQGGSAVESIADAMTDILASSTKVSDITQTITDIAFQTNLLALNAAVEAARAGEHGRGFAVVATEIRALSLSTSEASRAIRKLLEDSGNAVIAGKVLVDRAGTVLSEILASSTQLSELVSNIATASQEQSIGVGQIAGAVAQMDRVTQGHAEQTAELRQMIDGLAVEGTSLRDLASSLKRADDEASSRAATADERDENATSGVVRVESVVHEEARSAA